MSKKQDAIGRYSATHGWLKVENKRDCEIHAFTISADPDYPTVTPEDVALFGRNMDTYKTHARALMTKKSGPAVSKQEMREVLEAKSEVPEVGL